MARLCAREALHGGRCHNMAKKLVEIQNGGLDHFEEVSKAKMLHNEDKRTFALRE